MGKEDLEVIKMDVLIREQKSLIESVQKQLANHKKDSADRKTPSKRRLDILERLAETFWYNHKILMGEVDDSSLYIQTSLNDQFDEAFLEASSKIEDAFKALFPKEFEAMFPNLVASSTSVPQTANTTYATSSYQHTRLPKLNLPTFSGNSLEWPSFRDAFDTIDSDPNLSNAQKMQYLKGVLSGPAELLIRHLSITDGNYGLALDELDTTYNNKRLIFMDQLNTFFNQPSISTENEQEVQVLMSISRATLHGLEKLGVGLESVFLHIILQKLPAETRAFCMQSFDAKQVPVWRDLERAVQIRINSLPLEDDQRAKKSGASKDKQAKPKQSQTSYHLLKDTTCQVCDGAHKIRNCPRFLQMSVPERRRSIEKFKLCFNCLSKDHRSSNCASSFNCRTCGERYHSLLHLPRSTPPPRYSNDQRPEGQRQYIASPSINHSTNANQGHQILLATAIIKVQNHQGNLTLLRALLDQGSQASLITESAVQRLGLKEIAIRAQINGVGAGPVSQCQSLTTFNFGSRFDESFNFNTDTFVLKQLTSHLPTHEIRSANWEHIRHLQLADPEFMRPSHIDILLGADIYGEIIQSGVIHGAAGTPTAQSTTLGWVLSGKVVRDCTPSLHISNFHTQVDIDSLLRKFWELEETPPEKTYSVEDQWCENFFVETHKRQPNGKYLVQLPLKSLFDPEAVLGSSKLQAERRFFNLEQRFNKNPEFQKQYSAVINEYFDLGQMELEPTAEKQFYNQHTRGFECCYLPHHQVIKESSSTTKLRVVFDASAKSTNQKSLNDILVTGPALQTELIKVILGWRLHRYVFTCDIEKMYRRIEVRPQDSHHHSLERKSRQCTDDLPVEHRHVWNCQRSIYCHKGDASVGSG